MISEYFDLEKFMALETAGAQPGGVPTSLYLMQVTRFIKIGVAIDIHARRAQIQAANPLQVRLAWAKNFGSGIEAFLAERAMHQALHQFHHAGEWYTVKRAPAVALAKCIAAHMPELIQRHARHHAVAVPAKQHRSAREKEVREAYAAMRRGDMTHLEYAQQYGRG